MAQHREQQFWERLVAEVEGGATQTEIARRYGVSASNLGRWARRLKQERPRAQLLPVRVLTLRLIDGAPAPSGPAWWMAIAGVSRHKTGQDPRNDGRRDAWRRMPGWSAAQPAATRELVRRIRA